MKFSLSFISLASSLLVSALTPTTPSNTTVWTSGSSRSITWINDDNSSADTMDLFLAQGSGGNLTSGIQVSPLVLATPYSSDITSYTLTVPEVPVSGLYYSVVFKTYSSNDGSNAAYTYTPYFTINNAVVNTTTNNSTITVSNSTMTNSSVITNTTVVTNTTMYTNTTINATVNTNSSTTVSATPVYLNGTTTTVTPTTVRTTATGAAVVSTSAATTTAVSTNKTSGAGRNSVTLVSVLSAIAAIAFTY